VVKQLLDDADVEMTDISKVVDGEGGTGAEGGTAASDEPGAQPGAQGKGKGKPAAAPLRSGSVSTSSAPGTPVSGKAAALASMQRAEQQQLSLQVKAWRVCLWFRCGCWSPAPSHSSQCVH
jgi:hypothetical protein